MKYFLFKAIFILIIICVIITAMELGSILIYPTITKKAFSRKGIQSKLGVGSTFEDFKKPEIPLDIRSHILHPYLGFVGNPVQSSPNPELFRNNSYPVINEQGFLGESPLVKKQENCVTVAILGGSFARNLYLDSKETLEKEINKLPSFKDKEIKIISLALGGYKQPQQLQALNYYLSLGGEYDIVINIDGFNEVALPLRDNIPTRVYPSFPRLWYYYSSKILDVQRTLQFAHLIELKQKRQKTKDKLSNSRMSHSNFILVLWELLDTKFGNEIDRQSKKLETMTRDMIADAEPKYRDFNYNWMLVFD